MLFIFHSHFTSGVLILKGSVQQQLMINQSLVKKHPCMDLE